MPKNMAAYPKQARWFPPAVQLTVSVVGNQSELISLAGVQCNEGIRTTWAAVSQHGPLLKPYSYVPLS
jgi:hypothetical protein